MPNDRPRYDVTRLAWETAKGRLEAEISLFWNRGMFYWTFVAAILVTYSTAHDDVFLSSLLLLVGFLVSYLWALALRGSRKWQLHWEEVLRPLEAELTGPVYFARPDLSHFDRGIIVGFGYFSVSKIAILIAYILSCSIFIFMGKLALSECLERHLDGIEHWLPLTVFCGGGVFAVCPPSPC